MLCRGFRKYCHPTWLLTHVHQAMESICHTGRTILYDTVTVKGWSVDVRTHRIGEIINKVLADPWPVEDDPEDDNGFTKHRKNWGLLATIIGWSREMFTTELGVARGGVEKGLVWWGWKRKGPKGGKGDDDGDDDDDDGWEKHGGVPKPEPENTCTDCFKWYVSHAYI